MPLRSSGVGISGSITNIKNGTATPATNGILTAFTIAHGLSGTPVHVNIVPKSALSSALFFVTWDATNITVTYAVAPLTGNLSLSWMAFI